MPLYIPVLALISSLMLIKSKRGLYNKYSIFLFNFLILIFTELVVRYTGINYFAKIFFIILPLVLIFILYFYLLIKFSKKIEVYE